MSEEDKTITAYKAFDKDMKCRGFQYEIGKEYNMDGNIECCERGFHACEFPMEVWDYYNMLTSRFAEVELSGKIVKDEGSTKVCSSHIKIKAEIKLADIIRLGIDWINDVTSPSKVNATGELNDNGGYSAQIGSSGDSAQIGSMGENSVIMCAGNDSMAKAKVGSWITLSEWGNKHGKRVPKYVRTEYVDGERIKADTWYKLENGKFNEIKVDE